MATTTAQTESAFKELSGVAGKLTDVRGRLLSSFQALEKENAALKQRIQELESSTGDIPRLRAENKALAMELLRREKALAEREARVSEREALDRKLQNIRRAMRDLLSEQNGVYIPTGDIREEDLASSSDGAGVGSGSATVRPGQASVSRNSSRSSSPQTDVTIIHDDAPSVRSSASVSQGSTMASTLVDSNPPPQPAGLGSPFSETRTQRQARGGLNPQPRNITPPRAGTQAAAVKMNGSLLTPPRTLSPRHPSTAEGARNRISSLNLIELSPGSSEVGRSVDERTASRWRIHLAKPPRSASLVAGPLLFSVLADRLDLDDDTIFSLDSLGDQTSDTLRLQISGEYAFLHDPNILESPSGTYVVDWGRTKVNTKITNYIASATRPALHTFMYSSKKNGWFYLGMYKWSIASIRTVWDVLTPHAQRTLAARRTGTTFEELDRLIRSDELQQLTVELGSTVGSVTRAQNMIATLTRP
ncbi:hypothetical protein DENSPDRAFT_831586 [Dentipellis sp. KUC8613]|nr:hypothetical protein DENSPDRAFT_831586 [Dentipellis sp. KUC8613]